MGFLGPCYPERVRYFVSERIEPTLKRGSLMRIARCCVMRIYEVFRALGGQPMSLR